MKKILFSVLATLCVALGTFTLTSCGGDDDNASNPKVQSIQLLVKVTPSEDLLKIADFQLTLEGENGTQTIPVNKTELTQEFTITKLPVNATLKYTCKPKSGVTIADDDLVITDASYVVECNAKYSNGASSLIYLDRDIKATVLEGSQMPDWFTKYAVIMDKKIVIDKDGNWIRQ